MAGTLVSRLLPLICLFLAPGGHAEAQEAVTLAEEFKPDHLSRVDVSVTLTGRLAVPVEKGKPPQLVTMTGKSQVVYDERVLPPDAPGTFKTVRGYREVDFIRVLGDVKQDAGIRPSVRRMVMIKTDRRRAPFSPDGPLTWGEIDVVRTDIFNPAVVPGLLPRGPVRKGQSWKMGAEAIAELTDMEKVDSGEITVEFSGVAEVARRKVARLQISGSVRGVNEDGPNSQRLEGHAFFDLDGGFLSYLSLKGTHELLDGKGQTVGRVEGKFTMNRSLLTAMPADLSDASLKGLDLKPTPENTLLFYDDERLGVRFLYPRGWRIGAVQGRQVTLDHARGAGILITVESAAKLPNAEDYLKEVKGYLQKEKAQIGAVDAPRRIRTEPVTLDRFGLDVAFGSNKVRMECAVLRQTDGGVTITGSIPAPEVAALASEVERVIRSTAITRKIEEK
jgi:hypothetical protein